MKRLLGILLIVCLLAGLVILEQMPSEIQAMSATPGAKDIPAYTSSINKELNVGSKDFYRFFRDDTVKTLTVSLSEEEWQGMARDMATVASIDDRMRTGNYRKADITYEDKDGKVTLKDVGIRTKGNTTRLLPEDGRGYHRAHFKIKFNETFSFAPESEEYKKLSDRAFMSLNAIILKANMQNDPSFVHEKYAYELLEKAGAKVPEISLIKLIIVVGDEKIDYGVYTMVEPVDSKFIKKRYGNHEGNLYKCLWQNFGPATLENTIMNGAIGIKDWTENYRPAYDLKTNKDAPDHTLLLDFIRNLNTLEGSELKAYLEQNFEVDSFLKYMALNMLLGMPDDYWAMGNNYYLYFNPEGKIEFMPYDYDQCLAAGWDGNNERGYEGIANANILTWNNTATLLSGQPTRRPLIDKILSIDEYKSQYLKYLKDYTSDNGLFTFNGFMSTYQHFLDLYGPLTENDTQESSTMLLTNEEWYFKTKIQSVRNQLANLNR